MRERDGLARVKHVAQEAQAGVEKSGASLSTWSRVRPRTNAHRVEQRAFGGAAGVVHDDAGVVEARR